MGLVKPDSLATFRLCARENPVNISLARMTQSGIEWIGLIPHLDFASLACGATLMTVPIWRNQNDKTRFFIVIWTEFSFVMDDRIIRISGIYHGNPGYFGKNILNILISMLKKPFYWYWQVLPSNSCTTALVNHEFFLVISLWILF